MSNKIDNQNEKFSEKERMLLGEFYSPNDFQLQEERKQTQKLLKRFNRLIPAQSKRRHKLIKQLFMKTGVICSVYPPFYCDYGYNISVGEHFFANRNCLILDVVSVSIGNNVMLGPHVMILTATHPIDYEKRNKGFGLGKPVSIGDNVWIGAGAIINPGVHIGKNSIIGSGSVVTHDIPSDVIAAGNPCKVIRSSNTSELRRDMYR